jgi:hypothetical protein
VAAVMAEAEDTTTVIIAAAEVVGIRRKDIKLLNSIYSIYSIKS